MNLLKNRSLHYSLPARPHPQIFEGPQGYLFRMARINELFYSELKNLNLDYDYDTLESQGFLPIKGLDPEIHEYVRGISDLWINNKRIWNMHFSRFCPLCLNEDDHWKIEWEINYYDACHHHGIWLVDQCSSCKKKITWQRDELHRCECGSNLSSEPTTSCPPNMKRLSSILSSKVKRVNHPDIPKVLVNTNIEETQRLIRYLGGYMSKIRGRKPLKTREAGDMNNSWIFTSLSAEVIADWPKSFHTKLTELEKSARNGKRPKLNEVFGQVYHYVFKALNGKAFEELRHQFEMWIADAWRGGLAQRNKRLTKALLENATWIPGKHACEKIGITHQWLESMILDGTIEGEIHYSAKGRKFVLVRRDNLADVKQLVFGQIDMTTTGNLLGLQKRRLRPLLGLIFKSVQKIGSSPGSPWMINRMEVNEILEPGLQTTLVSIPDEDCVCMNHILKYWTWTNQEVAALIFSIRKREITIVNRLVTGVGISSWIFKKSEINNWKNRNQSGIGEWLTITQAAKVIGIKQQVAYELVNYGHLDAEIMPTQVKRGTRIKRSSIDIFLEEHIFATQISEVMNCSPKKVINYFSKNGIDPFSGPNVDGLRQVLYRKSAKLDALLKILIEQPLKV